MPVTWTDGTSGNQLLQGDNTANVNLGVGTPTADLSVNGSSVVNNNRLTSKTVASVSLTRFVGSITIGPSGTATVSGATFAGIGTVDQGGILYSFTLPSSFSIANPSTTATTTYNWSAL